MTDKKQPEALSLARELDLLAPLQDARYPNFSAIVTESAAKLRRLHAESENLHASCNGMREDRDRYFTRYGQACEVSARRLNEIATLEAQLSAIGAGGVEALRKRDAEPASPQDMVVYNGIAANYHASLSAQPSRECLQQSVEEVDFLLEDLPPVEGLDVILAEYEKTYGRTPDAAMASSVAKVKNMLLMWWGSHREAIAAALQAAPPAPAVVAVPARERELFDAWFIKSRGYDPRTDTTFRSDAWEPWKAWQARAALAAAPAQAQDDRAAFKAYLQECDDCEIVPDVAGAFHAAWQKRAAPAQAVASGMWTIWEALPGYLIDHCEGDIISEEGLQRALEAMLKDPKYSMPPAAAAQAPKAAGTAHLPYFSYDEDAGAQFWATQERAIKECQDAIDAYREDVEDGWPDDVESVRWGVVLGRTVKTDERPDGSCDYALTPYAPAQEHATQLAGQGRTPERQRMTAGRASFFMERFLKEEKLLGPNEQAALHFVIDMLAAPAQAQEDAPDAVRALIATHAEMLEDNAYAYFELAYTRQTGWMAWITDKPLYGAPVVNPDRKVLAQGQGDTPDEACADAARAAKGGAA